MLNSLKLAKLQLKQGWEYCAIYSNKSIFNENFNLRLKETCDNGKFNLHATELNTTKVVIFFLGIATN